MKKQKPDYVRMTIKIVDKIIRVVKKERKKYEKDTCGDSNTGS